MFTGLEIQVLKSHLHTYIYTYYVLRYLICLFMYYKCHIYLQLLEGKCLTSSLLSGAFIIIDFKVI